MGNLEVLLEMYDVSLERAALAAIARWRKLTLSGDDAGDAHAGTGCSSPGGVSGGRW